MSRISILVACVGWALALCACGGGGDGNGGSAPVQGGATLVVGWIAPSTRNDGTPLSMSEIAGYRLHFGLGPFDLDRERFVPGADATRVELTGLPAGRRVFVALRTVDSRGRASTLSEVVSAFTG